MWVKWNRILTSPLSKVATQQWSSSSFIALQFRKSVNVSMDEAKFLVEVRGWKVYVTQSDFERSRASERDGIVNKFFLSLTVRVKLHSFKDLRGCHFTITQLCSVGHRTHIFSSFIVQVDETLLRIKLKMDLLLNHCPKRSWNLMN